MTRAEEFLKRCRGRKNLAENEVKDLLAKYEIPVPRHVVIKSEEELSNIKLRYPLALKVCSPNILHKTDVGGVKLNIQSRKELEDKFMEFKQKFQKENMLVEEMEKSGVEIIVGVINDSTFGLAIMVGLGGIFTEVYKDVSFRIIPIHRYDAEEMLKELKAAKILEGFRGMKPDREGLTVLLLKVSQLASDLEGHLEQMDLNPVFLREKDLVVVDAKMILR